MFVWIEPLKALTRAIKPTLIGAVTLLSQTIVAAPCPEHFYSLPIAADASTCHQFNDNFPASMSYHSKMPLADMKTFYVTSKVVFVSTENHLGRYVFKAENDQYRVVISEDGAGTQVDLLVTQK